MPPRILIFVALSGDGPRAAAGAACELAAPGSARPLSLEPALAPPEVTRAADALAENLDLRPVAAQLALLSRTTELLRERPDATIVFDVPAAAVLVGLIAAADLARARLDAGRPGAGVSTLAAQRAAGTPGLAVLRAAAAAGDLLRAPELTSVGLVAGPQDPPQAAAAAHAALTFAGLAVLRAPLPANPVRAAMAVAAAGGAAALERDPGPVTTAIDGGAEIRLPLPGVPDDLRAVRSGEELALHAGGATRRLFAPASLGPLSPGAVRADDDGTVTATFRATPEGA